MRPLRKHFVCFSLLLLAGCAGLPPQQADNQSWAQHSAQLAQLQHWTTNGKIALRTAAQSESGSLLWRQEAASTHIRLSGPMGISTTTLDSDGEHLEIRQGEEYSRWSIDDPALAEDAVGQLPLKALHYWLKGIPAPQYPVESIALDPPGRLPTEIRQQGWTVVYQDFGQFSQYTLPTRLRVYRDEVNARIILRQWEGFAAP